MWVSFGFYLIAFHLLLSRESRKETQTSYQERGVWWFFCCFFSQQRGKKICWGWKWVEQSLQLLHRGDGSCIASQVLFAPTNACSQVCLFFQFSLIPIHVFFTPIPLLQNTPTLSVLHIHLPFFFLEFSRSWEKWSLLDEISAEKVAMVVILLRYLGCITGVSVFWKMRPLLTRAA